MAAEPDWLRLQKKIFTRYVQQTLRSGGSKTEVTDLVTDLGSGLLLIEVLEILSGKEFPGKKPGPAKARPQQIDNSSRALDFATKTCGITTQLSAEQLVDGSQGANVNLVLGTVFQIILKFMKIEDEFGNPAGDVKAALLLWWKNKTSGYAGVAIDNFTKSFHDGLAFSALINKMRPKLLDFASCQTDSKEAKEANLARALDIADKFCYVEKYLEASDISHLDEVSMIVYLSDWYYGVSLLQKQDVSAKRIGKLIQMTELHDKMRADYIAGATKFVAWVDAKLAELSDRNFDGTLAGVQARLDKFYAYKSTEKPVHLGEQMDLESLYGNLAIRLQNVQRPPFNPGDNLTVAALQKKIEDLDKAEVESSAASQAELRRQLKLHAAAKRYRSVHETLKAYVNSKLAIFAQGTDQITTVPASELAIEQLAVDHTELKQAHEGRFAELNGIEPELVAGKFEGLAEIQTLSGELKGLFDRAFAASEKKKADLVELRRILKLRAIAARYRSIHESINTYVSTKQAYFSQAENISLPVHAELALAQLAVEHTETKQAHDTRLPELDSMQAELAAGNFESQAEIDGLASGLKGAFQTAFTSADSKKAKLEAELKAQLELNDQTCRAFADAVAKFTDFLHQQKDAIEQGDKNDLEAYLARIDGSASAHAQSTGLIDAVAAAAEKVKAREIVENPHTTVSTDDCRSLWKMFELQFQKKRELLVFAIDEKKKGGLTPEQTKEIEDNFRYFDANKSNFLDRKELRSCLQSLGEDATPKAVDALLQQWDKSGTGQLHFDDFAKYMITKIGDTNSKDEILQAFKYLSFDKDYVTEQWLANLINDLSWKEQHVQYLKKECKPKGDGLDYATWSDEVFAR